MLLKCCNNLHTARYLFPFSGETEKSLPAPLPEKQRDLRSQPPCLTPSSSGPGHSASQAPSSGEVDGKAERPGISVWQPSEKMCVNFT